MTSGFPLPGEILTLEGLLAPSSSSMPHRGVRHHIRGPVHETPPLRPRDRDGNQLHSGVPDRVVPLMRRAAARRHQRDGPRGHLPARVLGRRELRHPTHDRGRSAQGARRARRSVWIISSSSTRLGPRSRPPSLSDSVSTPERTCSRSSATRSMRSRTSRPGSTPIGGSSWVSRCCFRTLETLLAGTLGRHRLVEYDRRVRFRSPTGRGGELRPRSV